MAYAEGSPSLTSPSGEGPEQSISLHRASPRLNRCEAKRASYRLLGFYDIDGLTALSRAESIKFAPLTFPNFTS